MFRSKSKDFPLFIVLAISTILCFWQINSKGLWIDEFFSMRDAQSFNFNRGRFLYYILLRIWMSIAQSDIWLRSLSIVFALASIYTLYYFVKQVFNRETALLSSFLLSISPIFINHAQEVRFYILTLFLTLLGSIHLYYYFSHRDRSGKKHISRFIWIISRVLACYTTPLSFVFVIADICLFLVYFLIQEERLSYKNISKLAVNYSLILFSIIPVFISVYGDSQNHKLTPQTPGLIDIFRQLTTLMIYSHPPSPKPMVFFLRFVLAIVLVILIRSFFCKTHRKPILAMAIWAFVPILIVFVFSNVFYSIWISRYVLSSLPYLLILLSLGLIECWKQFKPLTIIAFVLYLSALGLDLKRYYSTTDRYIGIYDQYRNIAFHICRNPKKGEFVLWSTIDHEQMTIPFTHYCDFDFPIYLQNSPDRYLDSQRITQWFDLMPSSSSIFWLVYGGQNHQEILVHLQEKFSIEEHRKFDRKFSVFLLQHK